MNIKKVVILIFISLSALGCSKNKDVASLIYFNDAHEISPVTNEYGERGGVARLKTVLDNIDSTHKNSIWIFGGDLAGGSLFGSFYHGFPMVDAFNQMPIDYANFGQHDFDFGTTVSHKLVSGSRFQWFTSNIVDQNGQSFSGLPTFIVKEINGIRVGLIGLTDAMNTTTPDKEVIQLDLLEAAKKALSELNTNTPDFIVAVTQTSFETNQLLLEKLPQLDAILTEEVSEYLTDIKYIGNRPVISVCGNLGSVAQLILQKNKRGKSVSVKVYTVDSNVEENPQLKQLQHYYQQQLDSNLNTIIAQTTVDLDAGISSDFSCRWKESNLGNLITDAYRYYFETDISVINGGGIRANILTGNVTERDIRAVLPFANSIVKAELSGKEIQNLLEQGVSEVEKRAGRFLQISGARYSYNPKQAPGKRITQITIGGKILDPEDTYSVALPEFILLGGDSFRIEPKFINTSNAHLDIDLLREYLQQNNPISSQLEGRIEIHSK